MKRRGAEKSQAGARVTRIRHRGDEYAVVSFSAPSYALPPGLTAAQREVVRAALAGRSNAEIARDTGRRPRTVANLLAAAYRRLGVRGRADLARLCAAQSLRT